MSKMARSARGEVVDFDLLAIKKQLATTPVPVSVNARRTFIDERDGLKTKESSIYTPQLLSKEQVAELNGSQDSGDDALSIAKSAVSESAKS